MTNEELCHSLPRFILEVRKKDGEEYPSETLYEMIIAIQLYITMHSREVKLLQDDGFTSLRNILDNKMKENAAAGKHRKNRQAEVISLAEEEAMWEKGVLGNESPRN